ncbi:hypothetical protein TNCV_1173221 [Trichonephila clavipes]|uniref:Uncharacterized protein n=1 Tax=Trichonephila clavipes TaxID=2585209 RepID=A0A8X6V8L4_TRICX|nr:hypothetical protein TNCV_1173221 [Trichonephila clavipes]
MYSVELCVWLKGLEEDVTSLQDNVRPGWSWVEVQEESNSADNEDENNKNESSKGPSNTDAFSELETFMKWYEQQSECCPTQLLPLRRIRDLAAKK